ncbi:MAG: hypothetical protein ACYS22_08690 [Planctomycetota bacterium]|jgi:hypothetical protein
MPDLDIQVKPWFRSKANEVAILVTNHTDKYLGGAVTHRGDPMRLFPLGPGQTVHLGLPNSAVKGDEELIKIGLGCEEEPDFGIQEEVTLPAYTFGSFQIDVHDKGLRVYRGVRFVFPAGAGELNVDLEIQDTDGNEHFIEVARMGEDEQKGPYVLNLDAGVRTVTLKGGFRTGRGEDEIPIGGKKGSRTKVEDSNAGLYLIERTIVATEEEREEQTAASEEHHRELERVAVRAREMEEEARREQEEFEKAQLEAQRRGEASAEADAEARRLEAIARYDRAMEERAAAKTVGVAVRPRKATSTSTKTGDDIDDDDDDFDDDFDDD